MPNGFYRAMGGVRTAIALKVKGYLIKVYEQKSENY
jgi:hypothetical protein